MIRLLTLLFLIFAFNPTGFSQNYAYIYIEGDLETPFYVKVEGRMQERLAKNYFIIPNLDAGYTNIEILFQQNIYPPQQFTLAIPETGNRGFVLHKVNDRQFALYDLQQKRYIVAGNKREDDWTAGNTDYAAQLENQNRKEAGQLPEFPRDRKKAETRHPGKGSYGGEGEESRFLQGIELNTAASETGKVDEDRLSSDGRKVKGYVEGADLSSLPALHISADGDLVRNEGKEVPARDDLPPVANTDCPEAMDNIKFEEFAIRYLDQADDDKKLKFLSRNKGRNCFSTEQVRILANNITAQSYRYDAVKMLYIQTSDQENYGKLETLFNTGFLKEKFRSLLK